MRQQIAHCVSSVLKSEKLLTSCHNIDFNKVNEPLFNAVVDHSFGGIFVISLNGNIIYVNKALEVALKTQSHLLVGKRFYQVWSSYNNVVKEIAYILNNHIEYDNKSLNITDARIPFLKLQLYTRLIKDDKGNPVAMFFFWKDENDDAARFMKRIADICIKSIDKHEIIEQCAKVVSHVDWDTRSHSRNVTMLVGRIASVLDLPNDRRDILTAAALLHDIGKREIPYEILIKPGRLSPDEFQIIKRHSQLGSNLVKDVPTLSSVAEIILHHHERFDGKGYPDGLFGNDIPLESRIINIADSYDAMTSKRCYKEEMNIENALRELARCSGSQFDPELVDIFIQCVNTPH